MAPVRQLLTVILVVACSPSNPNAPRVSKEPISVRGWISDVAGSPHAPLHTPETDAARKVQLFQSTNVWVDNAPYVSGGVAENGSFILLDVPPGVVTITFTAPGAPAARLILQNIPGNADVFVPAILLKADSVASLDPKNIKVRLAARVTRPTPIGITVYVAGVAVPVMNTPIAAMSDRHDYPTPPGGPVPLATVR
jgi:hypothetical protein